MDVSIMITALGTVATIAGVLYAFLRNFKMDIDKRFDEIKIEMKGFREENRHQFNKIDDRFSKIDERFERVDEQFEKMEIKIENGFGYLNQKIDDRFDRLDNEIKEIRTTTYRLEGAFYNQECCVVKEKKPRKKANNE